MRVVLTLALLSLCVSANATRPHHARPIMVHSGGSTEPHLGRPRQSANPKDPPVLMDQTPSYDDPSKFGGG